MSTNNPYSGTVLENTYSPVVFTPATDSPVTLIEAGKKTVATTTAIAGALTAAATITLPLSLPIALVASIAAGLSISFKTKKEEEVESPFQAAALLGKMAEVIPFGLWESIVKQKELKKMSEMYDSFAQQAHKDFETYCAKHENYLQMSMDSVEGINRRKVVMKDYFLQELSEQFRRCGLNGSFDEPTIERLDPRNWPINEAYDLNVESNHKYIGMTIQYMPLFGFNGLLIRPITNRIKIRKIRNTLNRLQIVAELNIQQMLSDLFKLELFSAALNNIDKIYKELLDTIRPAIKNILKDLEYKYHGDISSMPNTDINTLIYMKQLLKELTEITIVSRSDDNQEIYTDVCQYSNALSERYNLIRETIYNFLL